MENNKPIFNWIVYFQFVDEKGNNLDASVTISSANRYLTEKEINRIYEALKQNNNTEVVVIKNLMKCF